MGQLFCLFLSSMIKFKNVHYKSSLQTGAIDILSDININIVKGSFLCVIGKNGSGKTTLGKLIKGLILPTSGEVTINAKNNLGISSNVGYIFTNPENQIVHPVVEDDIAFGLENLLLSADEIKKKVYSSLSEVRMGKHLKGQIHWLSSGEQQKIVAAGVIAMDTEIIVFDEATAMLDGHAHEEFMKIVVKLNKVDGKTIIFITHDLKDALYADNILLLDNGSLITYLNRDEFFQDESLKVKYDLEFPDIIDLVNCYSLNENNIDYEDSSQIAKSIYPKIKNKLS